jgi:hypothetical protein
MPYFLRSLARGSRVSSPALRRLERSFFVEFEQRAGDAEAQRAGLAGDAATRRGREHIETLTGLGDDERQPDGQAMRFGGEALLERLLVDGNRAGAGRRNTRAVDVLRRPVP